MSEFEQAWHEFVEAVRDEFRVRHPVRKTIRLLVYALGMIGAFFLIVEMWKLVGRWMGWSA